MEISEQGLTAMSRDDLETVVEEIAFRLLQNDLLGAKSVLSEWGLIEGHPGDSDVFAPAELGEIAGQYDDELCPDCGDDVPAEAQYGEECLNCGHVWNRLAPNDDGSTNETA